jgi:hypothetical protein
MNAFLESNESLVVRTDFSDDNAWYALCAAIQQPAGMFQFTANVDFISDPNNMGLSPEQLRSTIPYGYPHSFFFIADQIALRHPDHPILVVDLGDMPGRTFRVIPSEMWNVENNLSISNIDFVDFVNAVDKNGVFQGFPEN